MKQATHFIQDACEKLTVALIQKILESEKASISNNWKDKYSDFTDYLEERGINEAELESDPYYMACHEQIPSFVENFLKMNIGQKFDAVDKEVEARINNKKADFAIIKSDGKHINFSLKNYKGGIRRPQVCSGTFNSFFCNFVFTQDGVGMYKYIHKGTEIRFKGSSVSKRDEALRISGYENCIETMHKLDDIQLEMRKKVLEGSEFRIFDEEKWKTLCAYIGNSGADLMIQLFDLIDKDLITRRILKSTGLIGDEELLAISPNEFLDSYTNKTLHSLRSSLVNPKTVLNYEKSGQSINFRYNLAGQELLKVSVPFTINSNGAWFRDPPAYTGKKRIKDKGHFVDLEFGQLRPYKSREIATSINTYLELAPTGIFDYEI